MTEVKVAEPGRKQETTPQQRRMNLHFGAPLPPQNRPLFVAALHPHVPFEGIWTLVSPLGITRMLWSKALSGTKGSTLGCSRRHFFFTHFCIFAALGRFFSLTLMFLALFSHVPRAVSFNPSGISPELFKSCQGMPMSRMLILAIPAPHS